MSVILPAEVRVMSSKSAVIALLKAIPPEITVVIPILPVPPAVTVVISILPPVLLTLISPAVVVTLVNVKT